MGLPSHYFDGAVEANYNINSCHLETRTEYWALTIHTKYNISYPLGNQKSSVYRCTNISLH